MRNSLKCFSSAALALALILGGCGGGDGGSSTPAMSVAGQVDRPASYDATALARQPAITQTVSFGSGSGTQTHTYTGASLWTVLNNAGIQTDPAKKNDDLNRYVLATGADGYKVVFALGELKPDFGNKQSLVAYSETINGVAAPLDGTDGPFRVTAPGDVKGGRYVSNLVRLDVRPSGSTATGAGGGVSPAFTVSGAVSRPASFDLKALQSLPATSQTVGANVYTGVSLWTLLDTVAGIKSDASVKNASLSMYAVATGSDGYQALVSLGEIDPGFGNKSALVAYAVNGTGLGANGVARLIVPGDVKMGRSVSNLSSIGVFVAAAP